LSLTRRNVLEKRSPLLHTVALLFIDRRSYFFFRGKRPCYRLSTNWCFVRWSV
jgi:hypothetical protein